MKISGSPSVMYSGDAGNITEGMELVQGWGDDDSYVREVFRAVAISSVWKILVRWERRVAVYQ